MLVWRNLIAIALLFVGLSARAGEPKIYGSLEGEKQFQIKVLPAQECERLIASTLYSTATIEQGVKALAEIEKPNAQAAAECLGATLDDWQENFPAPAYSPSIPPAPASLVGKLQAAKIKLQQDLYCITSSGCPNPLPKSEYAALDQQIKALDQKIGRHQFIIRNLAGFVFPSPEFDDSHFKLLSAKYSGCKKTPDSSGWQCGEQAISNQEYTARQEEISAAENEWFNRELAFSARRRQVVEELDYLFAAHPALWEKAQALFAAVKCVNPNHPHSLTGNYSFELDPDCPAGAKPAAPAQAILQAQELFGTTAQFLAKMDQRKRVAEAQAARQNYDHNAARNFNYGLEALLARYEHFLHHGGKPEALASFCAENERTQLRDHDFALVGEKMYAPVLSYAEDGRYLKVAREYGLSEGELWAINRFTSKFYSQINAALLAGSLSPELAAYKALLDSALAKLPAYQAGPVKRFVSFPQAVLKEHQAGKVVCYKSFSSSSKKPDWKWEGAQELVIYPAANGKDVSGISALPDEQEVLFTANSCFKVLSANGDASKFVLAEVDGSGQVIAKLPGQEQP